MFPLEPGLYIPKQQMWQNLAGGYEVYDAAQLRQSCLLACILMTIPASLSATSLLQKKYLQVPYVGSC